MSRFFIDGVELTESSDPIYLRLPDPPTSGLWCSPFEVTDKPEAKVTAPTGAFYTFSVGGPQLGVDDA